MSEIGIEISHYLRCSFWRNGVFALSETAVVTARKSRLQDWASRGNRKAKAALDLAITPNRFRLAVTNRHNPCQHPDGGVWSEDSCQPCGRTCSFHSGDRALQRGHRPEPGCPRNNLLFARRGRIGTQASCRTLSRDHRDHCSRPAALVLENIGSDGSSR